MDLISKLFFCGCQFFMLIYLNFYVFVYIPSLFQHSINRQSLKGNNKNIVSIREREREYGFKIQYFCNKMAFK